MSYARWIPPARVSGRVPDDLPSRRLAIGRGPRLRRASCDGSRRCPAGTRLLLLIAAASRWATRHCSGARRTAWASLPTHWCRRQRPDWSRSVTASNFDTSCCARGSTGWRRSALRQKVHRALGDATERDVDPDRGAWHRAMGAQAPDEEVAAELERSAGRATRTRRESAAAAAFLAACGRVDCRSSAEGAARSGSGESQVRGCRARFGIRVAGDRGNGSTRRPSARAPGASTGPDRFLSTGGTKGISVAIGPRSGPGSGRRQTIEPLDADLARDTYIASADDCDVGRTGRTATAESVQAAEASRAAPPGRIVGPARPSSSTVSRHGSPSPTQRPCRRSGERCDALTGREAVLTSTSAGSGLPVRSHRSPWRRNCGMTRRGMNLPLGLVRLAREAGCALPCSSIGAHAPRHACTCSPGEFAAASALIEDADAITTATGNAPLRFPSLVLSPGAAMKLRRSMRSRPAIQDATARGCKDRIRFRPLRDRSPVQRPESLRRCARRLPSSPVLTRTSASLAGG